MGDQLAFPHHFAVAGVAAPRHAVAFIDASDIG